MVVVAVVMVVVVVLGWERAVLERNEGKSRTNFKQPSGEVEGM